MSNIIERILAKRALIKGRGTYSCPICHEKHYFDSDIGKKHRQHARTPVKLTTPEQHQKRIAEQTFRMPDAIAGVMGGPSKRLAAKTLSASKDPELRDSWRWNIRDPEEYAVGMLQQAADRGEAFTPKLLQDAIEEDSHEPIAMEHVTQFWHDAIERVKKFSDEFDKKTVALATISKHPAKAPKYSKPGNNRADSQR